MFTNDSRWDRHLPANVREAKLIDVGVIFAKGKVTPQCFVMDRRKVHIKDVTYQWDETHGGEKLHYFSVTDGVNLYKIFLNPRYMHWRLEQTCPL